MTTKTNNNIKNKAPPKGIRDAMLWRRAKRKQQQQLPKQPHAQQEGMIVRLKANNYKALQGRKKKQETDETTSFESIQEQLEQVRQEIKDLHDRKAAIRKHQVHNVWAVYQYGLHRIANLNSLVDAPDAIMPGNMV